MYTFTFHRPETLRQAANLLGQERGRQASGRRSHAAADHEAAAGRPAANRSTCRRVEGLTGIELSGRSITIGAMTRHVEVAHLAGGAAGDSPVLAKLAGMIGDPAVRHMGTIGGSVANNDPNADYPAACLALGATIITNKRRIKADDFFTGMFSTALEPTEIITKVSFPMPKKAAYQKFRNQASRYRAGRRVRRQARQRESASR